MRVVRWLLFLLLMEVKFTQHTISPFDVDDSVAFSTVAVFGNRPLCLVPKHFHHSRQL